jgi:hypothetical protein
MVTNPRPSEMSVVYRILAVIFGLSALCALLYAGRLWLGPWAEEPGLVVEEPARVLDGLVPEREYVIEFRVQNQTGRALRVIGAPPFC